MFTKPIIFILLALLMSLSSFADIHFRDKDQTFNRLYHFRIEGDSIHYKLRNDPYKIWRNLPLHKDLNSIKAIASDDEYLIAIAGDDQIFTMFNGLSNNPDDFKWVKRWGSPFWFGRGMKLPPNTNWDISFFSPAEDKYYQAFNGNKYKVGQGVTNIFVLDKDQQTIIYLDPWLPTDTSYQACSPRRGRFKAVNISSSGSTIFLIGENGEMYTRLFDFDVVGADGLFFDYSYKPEEYTVEDNSKVLSRRGAPRPLPLPDWKQQPSINGIITDRITIFKEGTGGIHRTIRVEGIDHKGNNGYFTKDINEYSWNFINTGLPLKGRILQNGSDDESLILGPDKSLHFSQGMGKKRNYRVEIPDFNPYCSPSTLLFTLRDGEQIELLLHTREKIRQTKRENGLNSKPLKLYGTIEIPKEIEQYSAGIQHFLTKTLGLQEKFTDVKTKATDQKVTISKIRNFKWKLKRQ